MSLHFILGSSGSGKSELLYKSIIKASGEQKDRNFLVIVPEQYTMATQKKLVQLHPGHSIIRTDILSFQRLASRVFAELGLEGQTILDDTGKNLIIRKVMENHRKELRAFAGNLDKTGFVSEVKSVISELLQYAIAPDDMPQIITAVAGNGALADKLTDIEVVYRAFMEYTERDYITSESLLSLLAQHVHESELIKGSVIAIDGFTGFTPVQYGLLARLLETAAEVYVTVTIDSNEHINVQDGPESLFAMSKETISSLLRIADESHVEVAPYTLCEHTYRFDRAPELAFLEQNMFRYNGRVYRDEPENIEIYCGITPKEELQFIAAEILRLTREQGIRYRDIAVVSADIETYGMLAANIFEQNDIPAFVDYKRNIMNNPMIEFMRSGIAVIESGYSYESMFRFLRSGITAITPNETDLLENYCLALGIRGRKRWYSQWDRNYIKKNREKADLTQLNELRYRTVKILEPLDRAYTAASGTTVSVGELLEALYEFVAASDIEHKMNELADRLELNEENALASQYRQIYPKVMSLFDEIYSLLGEEKIKRKEFARLLDSGLEEIKVGLIPPTADCVLIGDMQRTRLDNIKVLFFAGVNDGIVPKKSENKGILSELDRYILENASVTLSPDARKKAFIERFYLYMNLTKPSWKLYLTYAARGIDARERRPSYFVRTMYKLYPKLSMRTCDDMNNDMWLTIPKADKEWNIKDSQINLVQAAADALYGTDVRESVTRLEQFASCEFAHFLRYGLGLDERDVYTISASDTGSILHKSMECISSEVIRSGMSFADMKDEQRHEIVGRVVDTVAAEYGNAVFKDSSRNEYMIEKVKELTQRTVWAIGRQLEQEQFVPESFEVRFSLPMNESVSKRKVELVGSIDRIDVCEDGDNIYIKIIDYKTGNEKFSLYKTYYGLRIQLMTYMIAAMEHEKKLHPGKNIVPAGAFYYVVDDPIVDRQDSREKVEKKILAQLSYDGIVNGQMPQELMGSSADSVKGDKNITAGQFARLSEHITDTMDLMTDNMLNGNAYINPVADSGKDSCEYCPYRSVCGFYSDIPGNSYRRVRHLKDNEVWERLYMDREQEEMADGKELDSTTEEGN
ncbi:PD-(D/E)XK nuclease family protein [[Bacteroides] pectinophilus]|uniref:Uncharacterized protein n=1 Tax=[Bacteroides] pectinophilus ATCC 43243 TaxID=483218 RepID=B7AS97_9FIRM|nr:putative ATP-dependent nuclease subunit B [[Bacteroides] pectinophilus ATCC 43243]UWN95039.1 PD-(D/E)XK nuclease family protein [[Bacteroides] pectinophilus]